MGHEGWPSFHLNSIKEVMDKIEDRIDTMPGPYQMFAELCDVAVFSDAFGTESEVKYSTHS